MAKTSAAKTAPPPEEFVAAKPPSGMRVLGTPQIDAYYKPLKGNMVSGHCVGHLFKDTMNNSRAIQALIKLDFKCSAMCPVDKELKEFKPGQVVAVDLIYGLKDVGKYITNRGKIWFQCLGKRPIKGGAQEMWSFNICGEGEETDPPVESKSVPADEEPAPF